MVEILIVSHGPMADATIKSVKLISGGDIENGVASYGLFHGDSIEEFEEKLQNHFRDNQNGLIVFTDMFGGSPTNVVAKLIYNMKEKENIFCICGFSLPLVLEAILMKNTLNFKELKQHLQSILKNSSFDLLDRLAIGN